LSGFSLDAGGILMKFNARSRGFSLLELVMVIGLVGFLASALYERVQFYQERAEYAVMELTASAIRSGLKFRVAAYMLKRSTSEVLQLNKENPVHWLSEIPSNYAGEFSGEFADGVAPGNWYYDPSERVMVYVVRHRNHFEPNPTDGFRVRFKVRVEYGTILDANGQALGSDGFKTIAFEAVRPYRWFAEP